MRLSIDPKPWLTTQHGQEVLEVLTHYWQVKSANSPNSPPTLGWPSVYEYTENCAIVVVSTTRKAINHRITWIYKLERRNPEEEWYVALETYLVSKNEDYRC
jgi:hypothetical protein